MPQPENKPARTTFQPVMGRALSFAPPLVLALFLFISWYTSTVFGHVNSLILPTPGDVLANLVNGLTTGLFLSNAWVTVQESVLGFLLALSIALPLGYGLAKSRLIAAAVQPYLAAGQAIPAIVIAPLLVLWLGSGLIPIVILCMLVVLFPMVITIVLGVQTIDKTLTDAARVEGASGWSLLAFMNFPSLCQPFWLRYAPVSPFPLPVHWSGSSSALVIKDLGPWCKLPKSSTIQHFCLPR